MPNEEGKLRKAIEELTKLPQKLKEGVVNFAESSVGKVKDTFTRENVVNAIMPKFFGRGVNKLLDMMGDKSKAEPNQSGITPEKPATETDDEMDIDLMEELLDTMDGGFNETNQNLTRILTKLSGEGSSNNSAAPLLLGYSNKTEESSAEIIDVNYEVLDVTEKSNETLVELLDINGQIVKTMQAVEKNTRVDSLKERENEIESRKARASQMGVAGAGGQGGAGGKGGGIMGAIMDGLVNAAMGYVGIKSATGRIGGKVLGGVKGAAGSVWQGVKGAAGSVSQGAKNAAGAGASAASNAWKNVGGAKGVWGAMKGAASRAPGPLKVLGLVGAGSAAASAAPAVSSALPALTNATATTTNVANAAKVAKVANVTTNVAPAASTTLSAVDDVAKAGAAATNAAKVGGAIAPAAANVTTNAAKVGGAIAPAAAKGGFLQGAKNLGMKALGTPLTLGMGAYEAYNVSKDEKLSSEQKTTEYSKIGGKTAGALAGAKAGAMVGSIGGPIGAAIGGVVGGIGGYFLGEKGGEIVGDIINAVAPSSEKKAVDSKAAEKVAASPNADVTSINSKVSETSRIDSKTGNVNVSNVVKPDIGTVQPGQTKTNNLQSLTQQIEQTNAEKQDMKAAPTVVPVTINNQSNSSTSQGSDSGRNRNHVPMVRNQDGTIQRLLDLNYHPLMT